MHLVLDEGRGAATLVSRLERILRSDPPSQRAPIFLDYLQRMQACGPFEDDTVTLAPGRPTPALPSSELKLLHLLAEDCSTKAMSERLFVSDSAVRTHVRNISTKLVHIAGRRRSPRRACWD